MRHLKLRRLILGMHYNIVSLFVKGYFSGNTAKLKGWPSRRAAFEASDSRIRASIIALYLLEDVLRADLGDVEEFGIPRDFLERRDHQFGVGEGFIIEFHLDQ